MRHQSQQTLINKDNSFLYSKRWSQSIKNGKDYGYKFPYKVSTAASAVVDGNIVYFAAGYGVGSTAIEVGDDNSTEELWFGRQ